jgi:hypothetical protein
MKRVKARIYTIDEWGRIMDLKARVFYFVGLSEKYAGRKVFIGEQMDMWDKIRYMVFNPDGSFLGEARRLEMTDLDVRVAKGDRKYKKMIKNIETLKRLQTEYEERYGARK